MAAVQLPDTTDRADLDVADDALEPVVDRLEPAPEPGSSSTSAGDGEA